MSFSASHSGSVIGGGIWSANRRTRAASSGWRSRTRISLTVHHAHREGNASRRAPARDGVCNSLHTDLWWKGSFSAL